MYYFWRALALTRDFWFLVVLAVASLLLNQGAKLLLPRIHGSLLDNVAHFDEDRFSQDVAWMLLLSVVQGLFGGVRNLCVAVIGRKTATVVRNRLFEAIIYQVPVARACVGRGLGPPSYGAASSRDRRSLGAKGAGRDKHCASTSDVPRPCPPYAPYRLYIPLGYCHTPYLYH